MTKNTKDTTFSLNHRWETSRSFGMLNTIGAVMAKDGLQALSFVTPN